MARRRVKLIDNKAGLLQSIYEFYGSLAHCVFKSTGLVIGVLGILWEQYTMVTVFLVTLIFSMAVIDNYINEKMTFLLSVYIMFDDESIWYKWADKYGITEIEIPIDQVSEWKRRLDGIMLYGTFMKCEPGQVFTMIDKIYIDDVADGVEYLRDVLKALE